MNKHVSRTFKKAIVALSMIALFTNASAAFAATEVGTNITTGTLTTGANGTDGSLTIYSEQGATDYSVLFQPHATMTQATTYTFPADDGTSGQALTTDGSGALSWTTASGLTDVVNDTTPQLGGMLDVNTFSIGDGTNELLSFVETASAVNEITIKNAATGLGPMLYSTGGDTNINLAMYAKGTGDVILASDSGSGLVLIGGDGRDGKLQLYSEQGGTDYQLVFQPHGTMTQNVTYTFPADDGTASQVLSTDGSGALSWATVAGGSSYWTRTGTTLTVATAGDDVKLGDDTEKLIFGTGDDIQFLYDGTGNKLVVTDGTNNLFAITDGGTTGNVESTGTLQADGLFSAQAGATIYGATTNINANSNFTTNINTGTSTGAVTIGGGSGLIAIDSSDWGISQTGDMTGIGAITADGDVAVDTSTFVVDTTNNRVGIGAATPATTLDVAGNISVGGSNNELRFYEGANYVGFEAPALAADQIWVLPTADGTVGQVLSTSGGGTLSWASSGLTDVVSDTTPQLGGDLDLNGYTIGDGAGAVAIDSSDWDVSATGDMTGIGAITMNGLLTGTLGATLSGAAVSLNNNSNFAVNVGTGTSTGAVTIGGGLGTVAVNSSDWDISTTGAMTGIGSITMDGDLAVNGNDITSTGALTITPADGDNLNITVSTAGQFTVNTNALMVDSSLNYVGIGTASPANRFEVETGAAEGQQAVMIDQNDADQAFIDYEGTSSADATNNISTKNGDGVFTGPKDYTSTQGWAYAGMVRVEINGTTYWMPYYSEDNS